jgi:hypothetical protein
MSKKSKSLTKNKNFHFHEKEKVIVIWQAKAACTSVIKMVFYHEKLLDEALKYSPWIHHYRTKIYKQKTHDPKLCKFIQFTVNPYRRAVSSYLHMLSTGMKKIFDVPDTSSFRKYINMLYNGKIMQNIHHNQQTYVHNDIYDIHYIKMEHIDDKFDYLNDKYSLNYVKMTSTHHKRPTVSININVNDCLSDVKHNNLIIPNDYSLFYDDDIKKKVDELYADDIKYLGYTWEEFIKQ